MAEVSSSEKLGQARRKLFKAAPKVAATIGLSYLATHESELASRGEFVVGGVGYYPLYERHDVGPKTPLLPATGGLFCEGLPVGTDGERIDGNFTLPPAKIIDYLTAASPIGKETIDKALAMGAVVGVGDAISFQALARVILTSPEKRAAERRRDFLGAGALLVPFLERWQGKRVSVSRRRFLKLGAVATAGLGLRLLATGQLVKNLSVPAYDDRDYASPLVQKAAQRLTARINGLVSHFNPEDYHIFSRNLLFALKTKMLAAYLKAEMPSQRPRVAFLVGANHAGTEDFLCLPAPVLRQMLIDVGGLDVYYSALEAGGPTNFATARLIKKTGARYEGFKLIDAGLKQALVAAYPQLSDD